LRTSRRLFGFIESVMKGRNGNHRICKSTF